MFKILLEDINGYLSSLANMDINDSQKKFFQWQYDVSENVNVVSYKSNEQLRDIVDNFLEFNKLKQKECYYNAYKLVSYDSSIQYVEGLTSVSGIPIDHAWNYWNGIYFDITREVVLDDNVESIDYVKIIKLSDMEVHGFAAQTGLSGPYIGQYYIKNILGE